MLATKCKGSSCSASLWLARLLLVARDGVGLESMRTVYPACDERCDTSAPNYVWADGGSDVASLAGFPATPRVPRRLSKPASSDTVLYPSCCSPTLAASACERRERCQDTQRFHDAWRGHVNQAKLE